MQIQTPSYATKSVPVGDRDIEPCKRSQTSPGSCGETTTKENKALSALSASSLVAFVLVINLCFYLPLLLLPGGAIASLESDLENLNATDLDEPPPPSPQLTPASCPSPEAALQDIVKLRSAGHRSSSFFARSHTPGSHHHDDQLKREREERRLRRAQYEHLHEHDQDREKLDELESLFAELVRERTEQEIPALSSSFNPDDEVHLQAAENFFFQHDKVHDVYSVSDYGLMALVSRAQAMVYGDMYIHLYDTYTDMKRAAGPKVDNEVCIKQLEYLVERTRLQEREKYYSKDLNLYQLLDTWGHVSSGILLGNVYFLGMYNECLRMKIRMPEDQPPVETRYCVLSVKHVDWPKIDKHDILDLKAGICIPKACDSSNYKNKRELLMRLVDYQLRRPEEGQVRFNRLYCLPDEDSPSRSLWQEPASALTFTGLCLWLSLLAFATYKHSRLTSRDLQAKGTGGGFGLTNVHCERSNRTKSFSEADAPAPGAGGDDAPNSSTTRSRARKSRAKIYQVLSVTHNLKLLFDTSKESSLMETGEKLKQKDADASAEGQTKRTSEKKINFVDLRSIEGIKVIAMVYVIMGHVLMCLFHLTANSRELATNTSLAFFLANLVPAFAVNAFFTITGTLTCYLILKQNQTYPFIMSPAKWFAFTIYRYLRIMPMYALVVLYCKTLAKFTGSGPLWDYGTSSLAQRRTCERESWHWTLLFRSNFLPPLQHCIPGGWYLSNDFQFFLVTPIYLALLYKRPALGRAVLLLSIGAGYLAGFLSILTANVNDLRPIANFAPHGFKTYVSHFSFNYTQPQYRIPAYLIGLLVGHQLYLYEQAKREYRERKLQRAKEQRQECDENQNNINGKTHPKGPEEDELGPEPDWSETLKKYGTHFCLFLVIGCCVTPVIGSMLPFTLLSAKIMVAFITPSYHVLFGLAVGLYLMLATTGNGSAFLNRALSAPQWKPFARLSLCAVLINVEVINYIVQGNTYQHFVSSQYHMTLNCLCIAATYLAAVLVCVLFEAPIRGALNGLLTLAITRVAASSRKGGKDLTGSTRSEAVATPRAEANGERLKTKAS